MKKYSEEKDPKTGMKRKAMKAGANKVMLSRRETPNKTGKALKGSGK